MYQSATTSSSKFTTQKSGGIFSTPIPIGTSTSAPSPDSQTPCITCEHHFITMIVLDSVGLILLILILIEYSSDLCAYCMGSYQADKIVRPVVDKPEQNQQQAVEDDYLAGPAAQSATEQATPFPAPSFPPILSPLQMQMAKPPQPMFPIIEQQLPDFNARDYKQAASKLRRPTTPKHRPDSPKAIRSPRTPLAKNDAGPMMKVSYSMDKFALPRDTLPWSELQNVAVKDVARKSPPIEEHESTGSTYFKQMMRGKRPIHSFSQYLTLMKPQKQIGNKHTAAQQPKHNKATDRQATHKRRGQPRQAPRSPDPLAPIPTPPVTGRLKRDTGLGQQKNLNNEGAQKPRKLPVKSPAYKI